MTEAPVLPVYTRCRLCGADSPLSESHIFPKFYWRWMKRTGGRYFRVIGQPNQRLQDGIKLPMLCGVCEMRFSRVETPFAAKVFEPLMANPAAVVQYGPYALRLLISVLWRNLAIDLDTDHGPKQWLNTLHAAELEWRRYLLQQARLADFGQVHIVTADFGQPGSVQQNYYMTRVAEATVMYTDAGLVGYYCKFAKFLVFAELRKFDPAQWVGTLVDPDTGTYTPGAVKLSDPAIYFFLRERATMIDQGRRANIARMTPRQQETIYAEYRKDAERLHQTEMVKALATDHAWSKSIPKVGRNEKCPCGSGLKYKRCHGW